MSKTDAQRFAIHRNHAGGLLKGIVTNLNQTVKRHATKEEKVKLKVLIEELEDLSKNWVDNYKQAKSENL